MSAVTLRQALADAKSEHRGPVTSCGFEERQIGPHTVNVLYYKVDHRHGDLSWTEYRAQVYLGGRKQGGLSFGS